MDGVTLKVDHNDQRLGVGDVLLMSGDATINVIPTGLSGSMEVTSISGAGTLTKVGVEGLTFTGPATNFSGSVNMNEGYVYLDAADAFLGSSAVTVNSNGILELRAGYALNGCTATVYTGGTLQGARTIDALAGSTIVLKGGVARLDAGPAGADPGGDIDVYGNSTIEVDGGNMRLCTIENLGLREGAYLTVDQEDQHLGVTDALYVRGDATLDIFPRRLSSPAQIASLHSIACRTLLRKGNEKLTIYDTMGIRLLGDADLFPAGTFMTITNAGAQITDNTTWEDDTMWTKGGSAATAITATLTGGANKGTIDNAHGSVSFASSDLGYVTVTGLKSGGGANARLVIMEFDSPSDLDGIQSKLEAAHPDWEKFFQKGSYKIGFTLVPTIDGTGYFGWDNKHGDLGANVLSIWFGPPDRGTAIVVL